MPILFPCSCGQDLRAADDLAGKRTKCPHCGAVLTIPSPSFLDEDGLPLGLGDPGEPEKEKPASPARSSLFEDGPPASSTFHSISAPRFSPEPPSPFARPTPPPRPAMDAAASSSSIREYSYLLLLLAMIPLIVSLLGTRDETDLEERIAATLEGASPAEVDRALAAMNRPGGVTKEQLLAAMPGGRLAGRTWPTTP